MWHYNMATRNWGVRTVSSTTDWHIGHLWAKTKMMGPFSSWQWVSAARYERVALAAMRSDGRHVGEAWADFAWQTVKLIKAIWITRLVFVSLAVLGAVLLHFHVAVVALVIILAIFNSANRGWFLIVSVACVVVEHHHWPAVLAYVSALWILFEALSVARLSTVMRPRKPYTALVFTPRERIRFPSTWLLLSPALDAAFSKNARFAGDYLERGGGVRRARWTAAALTVSALVDARLSSLTAGLERIELAKALLENGDQHPGSNELVTLAHAEVLLNGYRIPEALLEYTAALSAMSRRKKSVAVVHAKKRIVECLYSLRRDDEALVALAELRLSALRHNDVHLLRWTETQAALHMLHVGNYEGAADSVKYIAEGRIDSQNVLDTTDDHIARHLIVAAIVVAAKERGLTRHFAELVESEDDRGQVELALGRLVDNPHNRYLVLAHVLWARIEQRDHGDSPKVLRRYLTALRYSERLRVTMPSSAWRESWVAPLEVIYQDALELAFRLDDGLSMLEIVELARALPDPQGSRPRDPMVAMLEAAVGLQIDAGEVGCGQTLSEVVALRVGGFSAIRSSNTDAVELTDLLRKVADYPCYLSAAVVGDVMYWTFLHPKTKSREGGWSFGRVSLQDRDVSGSFHDLFEALPALNFDVASAGDELPAYFSGPMMTDTGPSGNGEEHELLRRIADVVLPDAVRTFLAELPTTIRPTLIIGASGFLNAVPFAGLPLGRPNQGALSWLAAPRLVESADIIHVPAWSLVAKQPQRSRVTAVGLALAVESPDPRRPLVANIPLPADVAVLRGNVSKAQLREAFEQLADDHDVTAYISCHGGSGPALQGLGMADTELLTSNDILEWGTAATDSTPMPTRMLISACESFGGRATELGGQFVRDGGTGMANNREWWGVPVAALRAGSVHLAVTRYPVDAAYSNRFDAAVLSSFATAEQPWSAVSAAQIDALAQWRRGDDVQPLTWQGYCYIGYGARNPYSWKQAAACFDGH